MNDKKTYPGFDNYIVYKDGRVFSISNNKFLIPTLYNNGYLYVSLCNKGIIKKIAIHRLICELFIPNPDCKPLVNHKDTDRTNNNIENLEWVTSSENVKHGFDNGREISFRSLSREQVIQVRKFISNGLFPKAIGAIMSIDYRIIAKIKEGKNYANVR